MTLQKVLVYTKLAILHRIDHCGRWIVPECCQVLSPHTCGNCKVFYETVFTRMSRDEALHSISKMGEIMKDIIEVANIRDIGYDLTSAPTGPIEDPNETFTFEDYRD